MVIERLTWIPHLWDKLICSLIVRRAGFFMQDLPEDILIDILSRLPGDSVLECRRVCKQWLALTSTPNFVELHLKRATPVLFVPWHFDLSIFGKRAKSNQMKTKNMSSDSKHFKWAFAPHLYGSCNGLLLFNEMLSKGFYSVWNPFTGEKVNIRPPVQEICACGFFFHPVTKDYRLLFVYPEGIDFNFFIYSLEGKLWRKLDNYFPYEPSGYNLPTILNGALHWMVKPCLGRDIDGIPLCSDSIMIFNMDTEEFCSMPHPGKGCLSRRANTNKCIFLRGLWNMCIYETKGKLALCKLDESFVQVWGLEDYEKGIWVENYSVTLCLDVQRFADGLNSTINLVHIQNDDLLFGWHKRGLFRCDLREKTVKKIYGVWMKQKRQDFKSFPLARLPLIHTSSCLFVRYAKTFVSPRGFG